MGLTEKTTPSRDIAAPIGQDEFTDFCFFLDSFFEGDYKQDSISKSYQKAKLAFDLFKRKKWTVKEFRDVMTEFTETWRGHIWYPADFLDIHRRLFGDDRMVM